MLPAELPLAGSPTLTPAPADALGHLLSAAVQRRAAPDATALTPLAPPVLARARTKQSVTQSKQSKTTSKAKIKKKAHRPRVVTTPITAPRRSGRTRRPPNAVNLETYWDGPTYGDWDTRGGGSSVSAVLGPAAGQRAITQTGSTPRAKACTSVNELNALAYDGRLWIKGHLLNDNLGGPGVSRNLTPLSHGANMIFKGFESAVKNAIDRCYSRGLMHQGDGEWYGVRFDVEVVDFQWPDEDEPAGLVGAELHARARYVAKSKALGTIVNCNRPAWASPLPAGTVVVDCV